MVKQDLKGKTAVVTGSAGGIGYDVACALLARGANVMLCDIKGNNEVLTGKKPGEILAHFQHIDPSIQLDITGKSRSEVVAAIRALRPALEMEHEFNTPTEIAQALHAKYPSANIGYTKTDVSNYSKVEALMQETAELSGKGCIDIVVNNAGIQHKSPIDQFPVEKWDQVIGINLSGVFYGIRAAAEYLKKSETGGRIFNIASVNGHVGSPEKAPYCAAKAAVVNLTRVAETDLRPYGIAAYSISPGFLDTPLARAQVQQFMDKEGLSEHDATMRLLEFQKVKEFIPVEHVSNIACNLSAMPKDKAMELSGRDVLIDNGWRDQVYAQRPPLMGDHTANLLVQAPENGQAVSAA